MTEREQRPQPRPSDEANEEQLRLAHEQGHVMGRAVKQMILSEAQGQEYVVGDYLLAYAVEDAEGMYHLEGGKLVWHDPGEENAHVEVVVRDAADGRFIPGLMVFVTLTAADGREIGTRQHPFIWHPWLHHYGCNWSLPGDGVYSLRVRIEPADFMRHDKVNGARFAQAVVVDLGDVKIKTGRKISK
jgi:hypothetical protein